MTEQILSNEAEKQRRAFVEITADEIPCDPRTQPLEFLEYCRQRLIAIGEGLPTPELEEALYRDIDLMLLSGFDGTEVQESGTFGDRRETFCVDGAEFQRMCRDAAQENQWPVHSTFSYATTQHPGAKTPTIVVFNGAKMENLRNTGDYTRTEHEYRVAEGYTMDDAAIAVFYLPS